MSGALAYAERVMTASDFKISVALATLNGERYLAEQLASLAAQSHQPCEVVALDDGSVDATVSLLKEFARKASFPVRVINNAQRLGYGMNFLNAAALCAGDAVAFCDQDDVWLPHKLERVAAAFKNTGADLVAHAASVTAADLTPVGKRYPDIEADASLGRDVLREQFYPGFSIAVSNKFFEQIRTMMLRPGFVAEAHDELICELARVGWERCELAESLVLYRQHAANLIGYHGAVQMKKVA